MGKKSVKHCCNLLLKKHGHGMNEKGGLNDDQFQRDVRIFSETLKSAIGKSRVGFIDDLTKVQSNVTSHSIRNRGTGIPEPQIVNYLSKMTMQVRAKLFNKGVQWTKVV